MKQEEGAQRTKCLSCGLLVFSRDAFLLRFWIFTCRVFRRAKDTPVEFCRQLITVHVY